MRGRIEHHRGGDDRPRQEVPARLVTAGDRKHAAIERAPLAPERRAQRGFLQRQAR